MARDVQTTYSELATLVESLPLLVREHRRRKGLSLRAAAKEIGCSFATVTRFEHGDDGFNGRLLPQILRWLDDEGTA